MPGYFWTYQASRNARLDPEVYGTVGQPVFFTIRAAHGLAPFAQPHLADIAVKCLLEQRRKSSCELVAYCVMPDHIHAVVMPALEGASALTFVDRFKGWCGRECRLVGWDLTSIVGAGYQKPCSRAMAVEGLFGECKRRQCWDIDGLKPLRYSPRR